MPKSSWRNAVPTILVGVLILAALLLVADARFRRGATLLGVALALAGGLRLTLPEDRMGPLAVRSKTFDVVFCLGLAGLIGWLVIID
jgi:hypothetical protein